jgi:hypothetical protein
LPIGAQQTRTGRLDGSPCLGVLRHARIGQRRTCSGPSHSWGRACEAGRLTPERFSRWTPAGRSASRR